MLPRALGKSSPRWFESSRNVPSAALSTAVNQFMKPGPQEKFTPPAHPTRPSKAQQGNASPTIFRTYSRANPQVQSNPESYASSSTQPPESRKYLKR